MRIALVYDAVYPFVAGGVERRNYAVAKALGDEHRVALYGFHYWADQSESCLAGCHYVPLGRPMPLYHSNGRRRIGEAIIFAARMFAALLRSEEEVWDVANFPFFSVPAAWLASRLRRRKLIVTWYELWGDYWYRYLGWRGIAGRFIESLALRCSPHIITTSEMTRSRLIAAGYPGERVTLAPCGVDVEGIARAPAAEEKFDIISVGRLLPHKRVEFAIEALLHLRRTWPDATLAIVGDGPERARLERRASELGLCSAVQFFGKLPHAEQVYGLLKSSRILVAPSEREGFGIAVIEAWACGIPAVVCAGSENAMPELIDQPFKGRVAAASATSIASACCELLEQRGENRQQQLLDEAGEYNWRRVAKRLETVYQEVLSSPTSPQPNARLFDAHAEDYDRVLNKALRASGETKDYFAHGRLIWLAKRLKRLGCDAKSVLDYGCGTGTSIPLFFDYLHCHEVVGVDVSRASLDVAARSQGCNDRVQLMHVDHHEPGGDVDLAFCNGVFHHILQADRAGALRHILRSLRPGGMFALWENNPWNLGARYCMRVNPFDRDAIAISPREAARQLFAAGFHIVETTSTFYFPRQLRLFRWLEPSLSFLRLGAQYLLLARKPLSDGEPLN